jgi:hypothetical protein
MNNLKKLFRILDRWKYYYVIAGVFLILAMTDISCHFVIQRFVFGIRKLAFDLLDREGDKKAPRQVVLPPAGGSACVPLEDTDG